MHAKKTHQIAPLQLASFCEQLSMIVASGLPVSEGVSLLLDDAADEKTREILAAILHSTESGSAFHEAIRETMIFPAYVSDMIELGELSGRLDEVLSSLARYYEREASIRENVRDAVTYPLIMTGMLFCILLMLVLKVLPVFEQIYLGLGTDLTGFAAVFLKISSLLTSHLPVFAAVLALLLTAVVLFVRFGLLRHMLQKKEFASDLAASRLANCIAMSLGSGLDTDQGLLLAEKIVDNPRMAARIKRCRDLSASGKEFADAVLTSRVFGKSSHSLITIGFRTGTLDEVMKKLSLEYEEKANRQIDRFIAALEPTLVIVLSLIIGLILVSFLLPLISIMTSIG